MPRLLLTISETSSASIVRSVIGHDKYVVHMVETLGDKTFWSVNYLCGRSLTTYESTDNVTWSKRLGAFDSDTLPSHDQTAGPVASGESLSDSSVSIP